MIPLTFCNDLLAAEGISFEDQCRILSGIGYQGVEVAPGFSNIPLTTDGLDLARQMRDVAQDAGLYITGLHWLLSSYDDLSITEPDKRAATTEVLRKMVTMNAALEGRVMVHGSPNQRKIAGLDLKTATQNAVEIFKEIADHAAAHDMVYCFEPLDSSQTEFMNTVADAAELVDLVANSAFQTMIDASSAGLEEKDSVADLIRAWGNSGYIGHIHLNDTNRSVPGAGSDPFDEIVSAIHDVGWTGGVSIEPFVISGTAQEAAQLGFETIQSHWKVAASRS
jgi:sugar phosphate isomerase/epimerase